jgi:hypothetical protein
LTSQAKYQRLAIVHLNRAHHYENLDSIIAELSPKVMELAPKGLPSSYKVKWISFKIRTWFIDSMLKQSHFKIPLLSMGPDVDVRDVKFKGKSDLSGEYFVEDVLRGESGDSTRRFIFQSIIPTVQTEVLLKSSKYISSYLLLNKRLGY